MKRGPADRKPAYHDALLEEKLLPVLKTGQLLVKMNAVAFNHRDVSSAKVCVSRTSDLRSPSSYGSVKANTPVLLLGVHSELTERVR